MHWQNVEVEFCASTIIDTRHVILKPSPVLGRLRVVGLASQGLAIDMVNRDLPKFLGVGLMQISVDHETLYIVYHVGIHVCISSLIKKNKKKIGP